MKSVLKIFLIIVLGLVLLLTATAAVITWVIDPNDYKDEISAAVEKQTGRSLSIPGDIQWSFFPWLGVELGEVRLGNAAGFKPETFAEVQRVEVRVRLWPLLFAELEADRIVLQGLAVSLQRNAQGISNWADLMQPAPTEADDRGPSNQGSGPPPLAALAIAGLEVRDARIIWDDRQADQYLALDPLNLRLGRVALNTPIPLEADFQVESRKPEAQGSGQLSLRLTAHLERQQLRIGKLSFQGSATSPLIPGNQAQLQLDSPQIEIDLARQTLSAERLAVQSLGLQLRSDIQASQILETPRYQASLSVAPFSPRAVLQQLAIDLPPMADPNALKSASLSTELKGDLQQAKLSNLFVQFDESELNGEVAINHFSQPAISFELGLDQIDVDRYLPPVTPAAADETAKGSPKSASSKPVTGKAAATPATAAAAATQMIPVEVLRPLNLDGTLRIGRLKAMNLHSNEIRITTRAKDGRLRLHPLGAQLYKGRYSGDIKLDVTGNTPRITLNENLSGVQIGPLLKDLWGDDKLRGRTDLSLDLNARGNDPEAIRQSLSGNSRFEVHDAEVKDIDMAQLQKIVNQIDTDLKAVINASNLVEAKARLDKLKQKFNAIKNPNADNASYFSDITGSVQLKNGLARNRDLLARLPFGRIRGEGTFDLVKLHSDYTAFIKLTSQGKVAEGKTYAQMDKTPVMIHFKGPLETLKPQVDFSAYLRSESDKALEQVKAKAKAEVKQKADKKIEQEKDELKQKLEDKAGDLLKKLFN